MVAGGLRNLPDSLSRFPTRTNHSPLQTTLFFCKKGIGTNSYNSYSIKRQACSTALIRNKTSRWLVTIFSCYIQSIITFYFCWNFREAALDAFPNYSWSFPPRTVMRNSLFFYENIENIILQNVVFPKSFFLTVIQNRYHPSGLGLMITNTDIVPGTWSVFCMLMHLKFIITLWGRTVLICILHIRKLKHSAV